MNIIFANVSNWFKSLEITAQIAISEFYTEKTGYTDDLTQGLTIEAETFLADNYKLQIEEYANDQVKKRKKTLSSIPTPWSVDEDKAKSDTVITGADGNVVGLVMDERDAHLIVSVVNSHSQLLEVLTLVRDRINEFGNLDSVRDEEVIERIGSIIQTHENSKFNSRTFVLIRDFADLPIGTLLFKGEQTPEDGQEFFNISEEMKSGRSFSYYNIPENHLQAASLKDQIRVTEFLSNLND